MKHDRPIRRPVFTSAFTLTELLVVMAVLGMLLMLAMPLFARAMEISRSTKCKTNLHNLAVFLNTEEGTEMRGVGGQLIHTIPTASRWLDYIIDKGMIKLVICPSGEPNKIGMKNLWIRQNGYANTTSPGVYFTNIDSILSGATPADPQVSVLYPAKGIDHLGQDSEGWDWVHGLNGGNPPEDNQAFVSIETAAAFLITMRADVVELKSLGRHPSPRWPTGSDHFIIKGDANEETWEEDTVVRLTGKNYTAVNPAVRVYTGDTHYGMSTLVGSRNYLHSQLWLAEYSTDMMQLSTNHRDEAFDDDNENGEVMGRHFGLANYVRVEGWVGSMSKKELEIEFENIDTGVKNVFQN